MFILPLVACALGGEVAGPSSDELALSAEEAALASAVLDFVNSATPAELEAVVAHNAAAAIESARPFTSVARLAATSYVGNSTLQALLAHAAPADVAAGAGFWDETLVSAQQADAIVDMANSLDLTAFGCDLGLAKAGQRIVAARPVESMDTLSSIPYVGGSQLRRFKANVDWFQSGDATQARFDCVAFTAQEIDAALQFVNGAGYGQLCAVNTCGFGAWIGKLPTLLAGRPWTSLESIAATKGFGPASMSYLRTGARQVLDGMTVGQDTVRRVLAGEVFAEWVALAPTTTLESGIDVGRVYVPGTGYTLSNCRRIADANEPDPASYSALHCQAGCSPVTRYWFHTDLGLVFYSSANCEID